MRFRSRALRLLLSALLVFSQHEAVLHMLGHGLAQLAHDESTDPQELVCAKCLAIAHLDHAVDVHVPVVASVASAPVLVAVFDPASADLPFASGYRSRAPPAFS